MNVAVNENHFDHKELGLAQDLIYAIHDSYMYKLYMIHHFESKLSIDITLPSITYEIIKESKSKPWEKYMTTKAILYKLGYNEYCIESATKNFSTIYLKEIDESFNPQKIRELTRALLLCFEEWINAQSLEFKFLLGIRLQERVSWFQSVMTRGDGEDYVQEAKSKLYDANMNLFITKFSLDHKVDCRYNDTKGYLGFVFK